MIKPKAKNADALEFTSSLGKELVAVRMENRYVYMLFDYKKLVDIGIENVNELPIGTKCVGKIEKIQKEINAAYVLLPDKSKAFLKDIDDTMKPELSIPVMITRAASKGKLCSVKLTDDDISHKMDLTVIEYGNRAYVELVNEEPDKILTDDKDLYQEFVDKYPDKKDIIQLYSDSLVSLRVLFDVSRHLKEATGKNVWLKSGANIVIENTCAFTVIDINSAKRDKKNATNDYLSINLEACEEIFRQLNLRNISGIILIDFINLNKEDEAVLTNRIKELCKTQKYHTFLVDITPLGIAEITRKKVGIPISEIMS